MPWLEASRAHCVGQSVSRLVCRSVGLLVGLSGCLQKKLARERGGILLRSCLQNKAKLPPNKGLPSKQVLLWRCLQNNVCFLWEGFSPKHKQTSTKPNCYSLKINSYPLSNRGAMARTSGAEVSGKHDDVVLVQLVLTRLAKCSPFPNNGFPGW